MMANYMNSLETRLTLLVVILLTSFPMNIISSQSTVADEATAASPNAKSIF